MSDKEVKDLITQAANAKVADDAMKFSQAAMNAAKALRELADIEKYCK